MSIGLLALLWQAAIAMHLASSTVNGNVCKHTYSKKGQDGGQKSIQMLGVFSPTPTITTTLKKVTYIPTW